MTREMDWGNYYTKIADRCPWSHYAWTHGKTLHIGFRSYEKIVENEQIIAPVKLWSIVYLNPRGTVDQLDTWCEEHTNSHIKYFFSHPEHSPTGGATPVPVIIQQRQDILEMARKGLFVTVTDSPGVDVNVDNIIKRYVETGKMPLGKGNKEFKQQKDRWNSNNEEFD